MVGKITTVLVKREAEVYRVQGLHKEALALYEQLMATTPNIDPALKSAIQTQVEGISREMQTFRSQRDQPLCADEIKQIKEGWGQQASQADIMVCAQALYQVGAYEDALQEYGKLLQAGCAPEKLAGAVSDCLVKAYPPARLPKAVNALVDRFFVDKKKTLGFQLRLAKSLAAKADKTHALAYYRHLKSHPDLPDHLAARLAAALSKYQTAENQPPPAAQPAPKTQPEARPGSLRRFLKSLSGKA